MMPAAPKLRFPEFKEPWQPGHAGDAFKSSRAKGEAGLPIYSVTIDRGLVRRDSLDRHMAADAADGQNLRAQRGDIVYNMMRMWQGAVGLAPEECMVSPAYVVLSPKKTASAKFFNQWFKARRMLYLLGAYSHGITLDRLRLYADDFARIPLHLPTLSEQEKIAEFLGSLDAKISALEEKKAKLDRFKYGLMQRLFSRSSRFSGEENRKFPDWETRAIGSIGAIFGGLSGKSAGDFGEGSPFVTYRQVFEEPVVNHERCGRVRIGKDERQNRLRSGDVLFTASSETPGEVGFSSVLLEDCPDLFLNSFCFGLRIDQAVLLPDFARYLFRSPAYRRSVIKLAQGTTRYNIGKTEFAKLRLDLPCLTEQRKVADSLMEMDRKIQAVGDQLDRMIEIKKGLLQQMFV